MNSELKVSDSIYRQKFNSHESRERVKRLMQYPYTPAGSLADEENIPAAILNVLVDLHHLAAEHGLTVEAFVKRAKHEYEVETSGLDKEKAVQTLNAS